jgi:hypothetical protein
VRPRPCSKKLARGWRRDNDISAEYLVHCRRWQTSRCLSEATGPWRAKVSLPTGNWCRAIADRVTGITADTIARLFTYTALNPALTLPLILLARYTTQGNVLSAQYSGVLKNLKALAGLGLLRSVSAWLDDAVTNNWSNDTYVWSQEVVVVTGGSDGIGKIVVHLLAEKGIKVAVLDVQDLSYEGTSSSTCAHRDRHADTFSTALCPLLPLRSLFPVLHIVRRLLHPLDARQPHGPHQQCRRRPWQDHTRVDGEGHQPHIQGQCLLALLPRAAVPTSHDSQQPRHDRHRG